MIYNIVSIVSIMFFSGSQAITVDLITHDSYCIPTRLVTPD